MERFNPIATFGINPLAVLRRTQEFVGRMGEYRRAIMWVSPVMTGGSNRFANSVWEDQGASPDVSTVSDLSRVSHVPIYVLGTDGLHAPTADDMRSRQGRNYIDERFAEQARTIASLTGGRAIVATNAPAALVPAVFDELNSYYVLAYENSYALDGRHRWLQIDVKHPDAMVVRPRSLISPIRSTRTARRDVGDRPEGSGLLEAIGAPLPTGDLPLRLSNVTVAVPNSGEQAVALTLGLPRVPAGTTEAFRVQLALFDSEGRRELLAQTHDVKVPGRELREGELNEIALRLDLRPDRYHLRIAVERVATRTAGSVHATLIVPDFERETLSLSGVSLLRPDGPPIAGRESLAPLLPGAPTAVRTLRQTDKVTAVLRVHQSKRGMPQAVVLNTTILDAAGGEVYTASHEVAGASFADANGVEHRFELPLEGLEPGDYLLRFVATAGSRSLQRDIRFTVIR